MFQVERQQDRELESLLVQYREEEGESSENPSLPLPLTPGCAHSVWEKKDPANVPG